MELICRIMEKQKESIRQDAPFFENLEVSFYFDNEGKPVQVNETDYIIYEGGIFPMVVFSDELRTLNIKERMDYYIKEEREPSVRYIEFTPYDMQMSLEARQSQWKWITDVVAGHLVILLYSFFRKDSEIYLPMVYRTKNHNT